MSFATGVAVGFAMGKKMFEGGKVDAPDPDYQLYKALPEPNENQIVILLRIADITEQSYFNVHFDAAYSIEDIGENEGVIDWGDGSITHIGTASYGSHAYSGIGDYIITITDNSGGKIESVCCCKRRNYGYPIAMKVGSAIIYDDGLGGKYIGSVSDFKYIQFATDYIWKNGFVFNGAQRLTKIDFLSSTKPDKLLNNQFYGCYALDFDSLMPLFSEVTEVGNSAFNSCYGLKKLELPKCTKVGNSSIYQCYSLKELVMPLCSEVGNFAISYNNSLSKIVLNDNCTFGKNTMQGCNCLIPTPNGIYPY